MPETIAAAPRAPAAAALPPGLVLLDLMATLLAPMFLGVTGGDSDLARAAALETINDYRARSGADLICIGQIIAFGLAAIGTITQSTAEDLPPETRLRLHASADTLSRGGERGRRALDRIRRETPPPPPAMPPDDLPEAAVLAQVEHARRLTTPQSEPPARSRPAATPLPTARTDNPRSSNPRTGWAAAFADVAQEVAASLPFLPPEERRTAKIRAAALSSTASTLIAGTHPRSLKS